MKEVTRITTVEFTQVFEVEDDTPEQVASTVNTSPISKSDVRSWVIGLAHSADDAVIANEQVFIRDEQ